jgi:hypothetical protein
MATFSTTDFVFPVKSPSYFVFPVEKSLSHLSTQWRILWNRVQSEIIDRYSASFLQSRTYDVTTPGNCSIVYSWYSRHKLIQALDAVHGYKGSRKSLDPPKCEKSDTVQQQTGTHEVLQPSLSRHPLPTNNGPRLPPQTDQTRCLNQSPSARSPSS